MVVRAKGEAARRSPALQRGTRPAPRPSQALSWTRTISWMSCPPPQRRRCLLRALGKTAVTDEPSDFEVVVRSSHKDMEPTLGARLGSSTLGQSHLSLGRGALTAALGMSGDALFQWLRWLCLHENGYFFLFIMGGEEKRWKQVCTRGFSPGSHTVV